MSQNGAASGELRLDALQDPTDRYELGECVGKGVYADVYEAADLQAGGRRVAVKIQKVDNETLEDIREEYCILRDLSSHGNLPDFYGVYLKKGSTKDDDQLWFVMELCEGGPITNLVKGLQLKNKRLSEEHIAYILKESIKALMHLHENHVIHRDVRGSNILLTKEGQIKLVDFGLAREMKSTMGKRGTCVGSPCWMAPEVVTSAQKKSEGLYDNRADVWALGITAIELGDGKPPFHDMHPTRALFQIVRNPPPGLYRPANWTQEFNDFIAECLEKNPDHRPYIMELMEHPFITSLPENDYHLSQELKSMVSEVSSGDRRREPRAEVTLRTGYLKVEKDADPEPMYVEDLAALEDITEDNILSELYERLKMGQCHTFVGDVLLVLNPNEQQPIYSDQYHYKYQYKSRSQNSPHIYAVADRAYQDMLHHEEPQHILLAGESLSGKTTNMMHLFRHLLFLGKSGNGSGDRVEKAMHVIQALGNASTPLNPDSTRHILQLQLTFTKTGKVSGGIFWLYQLEKSRVTTTEKLQGNFHFFYYFYDAMEAKGTLNKYNLEGGRNYRYLRCDNGAPEGGAVVRNNAKANVVQFHTIQQHLTDLDIEEEKIDTLYNGIAAILLLGEVQFQANPDGQTEICNPDVAATVAQLLCVDEKKFAWSLINYCLVEKGTAVRRRHTLVEAIEARDVLARGLYQRIVDWVVNVINFKLSYARAMFGDFHYVSLMDLFGFECFPANGLEQLLVNTMNEQMQFHYNQRVFVWEMQEQEEEEIPIQTLQYYDNRPTLDALMKKSSGFLYLLDEASKTCQDTHFIMSTLRGNTKGPHLRVSSAHEFSVAHFTGTVSYDVRDMADKNHDFLPPEMIETLRSSTNATVKKLFTNQMSRNGILTFSVEEPAAGSPTTEEVAKPTKKGRWGAILVAENQHRARKYNTESHGQYSQTRGMRTAAATFRATSLDVLRGLAVGAGSGGTHFVRCLRSDLTAQPRGFQSELVRQQMKALAVVDTARARQKGFPHRIPFAEFIRRYQFLAFDFDETVELTKENSRLLLVRLKMEGWVIGKSKVFLKYYNEEYLSMKYEVQVKKIVKVQTMMRAFLARKNVATKLKRMQTLKSEDRPDVKPQLGSGDEEEGMSKDEAATLIQKEFRGYQVRKHLKPLLHPNSDKLDSNTADFIRQYCKKWKAKSIFQVLLFYRAARHQDLVYFSQQVHLYNQNTVLAVNSSNQKLVPLDNVDPAGRASSLLGKSRPSVWKLPFNLHDLTYFDTTYLCDPLSFQRFSAENELDVWDAPLRRTNSCIRPPAKFNMRDQESQTTDSPHQPRRDYAGETYTQLPYCRDPKAMPSQQAPPPKKKASCKYRAPQPASGPPRKFGGGPAAPSQGGANKNQGAGAGFGRESEKRAEKKENWNGSSQDGKRDQFLPKIEPISKAYKKPGGNQQGKPNPIVEMESKYRLNSNDSSNEDPPFNFQAMLKKTNTNRASLRRVRDIDQNSYDKEVPMSHHYNRNNERNSMHQPSELKGSNQNRALGGRHWQNNNSHDVITELAPGIIIQGQVADL